MSLSPGTFGCAVVATAGATTTAIDYCYAKVTDAWGTLRWYPAQPTFAPGTVAATAGTVDYDPARGDTMTVCWGGNASFTVGAPVSKSACVTVT